MWAYLDNEVNPISSWSYAHMAMYPGMYLVRATKTAIRKQHAWALRRLHEEECRLYEKLAKHLFKPVRVIETLWTNCQAATAAADSAAEIMDDYTNWRAQQSKPAVTAETAAAVFAACPPNHGALRVEGARVSCRAPRPTTAVAGTTGTAKTHNSGNTNSCVVVDSDAAHGDTHSAAVVASSQGPDLANVDRHRSGLGMIHAASYGQRQWSQGRQPMPKDWSRPVKADKHWSGLE
jgi:hypothetical protein